MVTKHVSYTTIGEVGREQAKWVLFLFSFLNSWKKGRASPNFSGSFSAASFPCLQQIFICKYAQPQYFKKKWPGQVYCIRHQAWLLLQHFLHNKDKLGWSRWSFSPNLTYCMEESKRRSAVSFTFDIITHGDIIFIQPLCTNSQVCLYQNHEVDSTQKRFSSGSWC